MASSQGDPSGYASRVTQALKVLAPSRCAVKDAVATGNSSRPAGRGAANRRRKRNNGSVKRGGGSVHVSKSQGQSSLSDKTFWVKARNYLRDVQVEDIEAILPLSDAKISPLLVMPPRGLPYSKQWANDDCMAREAAASAQRAVVSVKLRKKLLHATSSQKLRRLPDTSTSKIWKTTISCPAMQMKDACDVCYGTDASDLNKIIFCDGCEVPVHQECYGMTKFDGGPWLCLKCKRSPSKTICSLCPVEEGAMKQVSLQGAIPIDRFCHVFCCLWTPETFAGTVSNGELVCFLDGLESGVASTGSECSVCSQDVGVCVQCSAAKCESMFHPMCARRESLYMEIVGGEESEDIHLVAYCREHTRTREKYHFQQVLRSTAAVQRAVVTVAEAGPNLETARSDHGDCSDSSLWQQPDPSIKVDGGAGIFKLSSVTGSDHCGQTEGPAAVNKSGLGAGGSGNRSLPSTSCQVTEALYPRSKLPRPEDVRRGRLAREFPSVVGSLSRIPVPSGCIHPHIKQVLDEGVLGLPSPFSHFPSLKIDLCSEAIVRSEVVWKPSETKDTGQWETLAQSKEEGGKEPVNENGCGQMGFGGKMGVGIELNHLEGVLSTRGEEAMGIKLDYRVIPLGLSAELDEVAIQLKEANDRGLFGTDPQDEVERELLRAQKELLELTRMQRHRTDSLLSKVLQDLGQSRLKLKLEEKDRCDVAAYVASEREKAKQLKIENKRREDRERSEALQAALTAPRSGAATAGRIARSGGFPPPQPTENRGRRVSAPVAVGTRARRGGGRGASAGRATSAGRGRASAGRGRPAGPRVESVGPLGRAVSSGPAYGFISRVIAAGQVPLASGGLLQVQGRGRGAAAQGGAVRGAGPSGLLRGAARGGAGRGEAGQAGERVAQPFDLVHGGGGEGDPGVVCSVCASGDSEPANSIHFCDRCRVAVHQDCYGVLHMFTNVWLCEPCIAQYQATIDEFRAVNPDISFYPEGLREMVPAPVPDLCGQLRPGVQCHLCPSRVGAFKKGRGSQSSLWAHVFCAQVFNLLYSVLPPQWLPETSVSTAVDGSIDGLDRVAMDRFNCLCIICQRSQGACLTCNFGHCSASFHPCCARNAGLLLAVRAGPGGRVQLRAYCNRHSPSQRAKLQISNRGAAHGIMVSREIRVNFEMLRLICERVLKRERVKREMVLAVHGIHMIRLFDSGDTFATLPHRVLDSLNLIPGGRPQGFGLVGLGQEVVEMDADEDGEEGNIEAEVEAEAADGVPANDSQLLQLENAPQQLRGGTTHPQQGHEVQPIASLQLNNSQIQEPTEQQETSSQVQQVAHQTATDNPQRETTQRDLSRLRAEDTPTAPPLETRHYTRSRRRGQ